VELADQERRFFHSIVASDARFLAPHAGAPHGPHARGAKAHTRTGKAHTRTDRQGAHEDALADPASPPHGASALPALLAGV